MPRQVRILAELVSRGTTIKLDWTWQRLDMGDGTYCCRLIREGAKSGAQGKELAANKRKNFENVNKP